MHLSEIAAAAAAELLLLLQVTLHSHELRCHGQQDMLDAFMIDSFIQVAARRYFFMQGIKVQAIGSAQCDEKVGCASVGLDRHG